MKIPRQQRLRWLTVVYGCLRLFGKPPSTTVNGAQRPQPRSTARSAGYTLIEVLAAASIVSIGTTAMVILQQSIFINPVVIENGLTTVNGVVMETMLCTAIVNSSQNPSAKAAGASFTLTAYRPHLVTELRTAPP